MGIMGRMGMVAFANPAQYMAKATQGGSMEMHLRLFVHLGTGTTPSHAGCLGSHVDWLHSPRGRFGLDKFTLDGFTGMAKHKRC